MKFYIRNYVSTFTTNGVTCDSTDNVLRSVYNGAGTSPVYFIESVPGYNHWAEIAGREFYLCPSYAADSLTVADYNYGYSISYLSRTCPLIHLRRDTCRTTDWANTGWNTTDIPTFRTQFCTVFKRCQPKNADQGGTSVRWGQDNGEINVLFFRWSFDDLPGTNFMKPIFMKGNDPNCDEMIEVL
jgi:hypothetical protein